MTNVIPRFFDPTDSGGNFSAFILIVPGPTLRLEHLCIEAITGRAVIGTPQQIPSFGGHMALR
jgi:hypothetical protein